MEEPPELMSGSVSPLTGARPADMVTLYITWNMKQASTPSTRYAPRRSLASRAASTARSNHEQIQAERDDHAGKSSLLGKCREDEIVLRLRQEPLLRLSALPNPLPQNSPEPAVMRA